MAMNILVHKSLMTYLFMLKGIPRNALNGAKGM